jgi:FAD:protein FMN transferase
MSTTFEIFIAGQDPEYAGQAAQAAFRELDRLELELSRYIPFSDVSNINALAAGEAITIDLSVYECLQEAARIHTETGGAFDVTIGPLLDWWRARRGAGDESELQGEDLLAARARTGMGLLEISPEQPMVGVRTGGLILDLGAIGKGYALDVMGALLREWGMEWAMIHGGQSSVLAIGPPEGQNGWLVPLRNPENHDETFDAAALRDCSMSGSGIQSHGAHIINPRTGRPATDKLGAWAIAPTAAASDAISTAFMVMSEAEVEAFCAAHKDVSAVLMAKTESGRTIRRFGVLFQNGS